MIDEQENLNKVKKNWAGNLTFVVLYSIRYQSMKITLSLYKLVQDKIKTCKKLSNTLQFPIMLLGYVEEDHLHIFVVSHVSVCCCCSRQKHETQQSYIYLLPEERQAKIAPFSPIQQFHHHKRLITRLIFSLTHSKLNHKFIFPLPHTSTLDDCTKNHIPNMKSFSFEFFRWCKKAQLRLTLTYRQMLRLLQYRYDDLYISSWTSKTSNLYLCLLPTPRKICVNTIAFTLYILSTFITLQHELIHFFCSFLVHLYFSAKLRQQCRLSFSRGECQ